MRNKWRKVLLDATVEGAVKSAPLLWRVILSEIIMNLGLLPTFQGHKIATRRMWFICCNVISATKNMLAALRLSSDNGSMFTSPNFALMRANTTRAVLTGVSQFHRQTFLLIFSVRDTRVHFRWV